MAGFGALEARLPRGGPFTLAAVRVLVAVLVYVAPEIDLARELARTPLRITATPEGLGGVVALLPSSTRWVPFACLALRGAAALTALGVGGRSVRSVFAALTFVVFSFSQRTGAVLHDMHLVWFALLVALAPSDDALSLEAWSRGRARCRDPRAYGVALAGVRALLATVYFFPGLAKLFHGGKAWWSGEILAGQMHFKWYEAGRVLAPFRVDQSPTLLAVGASLVLLFELSFPLLALVPRLRVIALVGGLVFHGLSERWLGIRFVSLWAFYVVFVDVDRWVLALKARFGRTSSAAPKAVAPPDRERWILATAAASALLVVGQVVQGARGQMQGYPFACYPTFADVAPKELPDVDVSATDETGAVTWLLSGKRTYSQAEWAELWRALGVYDGVVRADALRLFVQRDAARRGVVWPSSPATIRVYRARYEVRPEAWGAPPVSRTPILDW
jgi:hypothetical protein